MSQASAQRLFAISGPDQHFEFTGAGAAQSADLAT
jgi:hypothetical protein